MFSPGATINQRYYLEKTIGEGGFAQVFLAKDILLSRAVAIKVLNADFEGNQEFLRRFQNEARAIAALDHPNILQIYDFGMLPNNAYLVMPYLSGGSFASLMRGGRLSFDEIAYYLDQLCQAIDYAHRQGVAHRDIKPQNILLRGVDGRAVLADFGFAKLVSEVGMSDQTRQMLGTPHYMAPEQFAGKVGFASDQYSLGIVLYQMLTESLPFMGTEVAIIKAHLEQAPTPLAAHPNMKSFNPEIIARLDKVLERALAKRPDARYPNCEALFQAYKAAIKSEVKTPAPMQPKAESDQTEVFKKPLPAVPPPSKPAAPVMQKPAILRIRTDPDQRIYYDFELKGAVLKLGREVTNDLHVPLSIVSRHHATFYRVGENAPGVTYRIVDNNSLNKLFYNNQQIKERVLQDGDVIQVGVRGYGDYVVFFTFIAPVFS